MGRLYRVISFSVDNGKTWPLEHLVIRTFILVKEFMETVLVLLMERHDCVCYGSSVPCVVISFSVDNGKTWPLEHLVIRTFILVKEFMETAFVLLMERHACELIVCVMDRL